MGDPQVTLYIHPLCPYAQRALYTVAYKSLDLTIEAVDLEHKADWFLVLNPLGKVPTLKVVQRGREYHLYESINVAEYLDTLSGPSLYPLLESGERDPVKKALIDGWVKTFVDSWTTSIFPFYFREATTAEIQTSKSGLKLINDRLLASGNYLMNSVLGEDVLTIADVILLPFVERVVVLKDNFMKAIVDGEDFGKVFAWFERIIQTNWASKYRVNPTQLTNLIRIIHSGNYHGLALPLSRYD